MILELLKNIPNIKTTVPEGAFYVFPDVSYYFGKSYEGKTIKDADDLSMIILNDALVSTVSGAGFGEPKCIRISYAASDEDIREAIRRIGELMSKLK
jgi:aspartate aminotransferase